MKGAIMVYKFLMINLEFIFRMLTRATSRQMTRKKVSNKRILSGCNTKFSELTLKKLYGYQQKELIFLA